MWLVRELVLHIVRFLRDGKLAMLSGRNKLYTIPPDLVAQCVKLDLAKHFRVPLCRSYEPETSIFLVAADGFYSLDRRPRDIREVKG